MKFRSYLFSILCFLSVSVTCQEKFEKEYSVKPTQIPTKSIKLIAKWQFTNNVKWFAEESNDGKTYEAKVCHKKYKYSIEFTEQGNIIDAEKTVKFSELSANSQQKITIALRKKFIKFKIKKVQIQYSGNQEAIFDAIFNLQTLPLKAILNFEIVVKGKQNKKYDLYEFLLNQNGEIIKEFKFLPSNSDNLEF